MRSLCVYYVRMARVNVYLPEELAEEARAADVNVSNVTQEALRRELSKRHTSEWLDRVKRLPRTSVTHEDVMAAVDEARSELEMRG